jgi:acetolactate synthase, small subunit
MRRILSVLLENESGALSRVIGLFAQRGYNIESLTVAPTDDPTLSRMREQSRGPQVPAGLPMTEEQLRKLGGRQLRALGKLMPGEEEVAENPRARSSVLRVAERTNA